MSITYILQMDGPGALVKIGRTKNPKSRIAALKTGLPWPCRIVALVGADVERDLHQLLKGHRAQGEWFHPSAQLADWLIEAAARGALVKQTPVDNAYINAVIKPRIKEYLNGREPFNNSSGDLVCRIFADMLPTLTGREKELGVATKGHVTEAMCRGFGPSNEVPVLKLAHEERASEAAA